jgi:hypothetical protein
MEKYYLVAFNSADSAVQQAGFEVCLALTTLDLPLHILLHRDCADENLRKQLASLSDYGFATVHDKNNLTDFAYQQLIQTPHFLLCF